MKCGVCEQREVPEGRAKYCSSACRRQAHNRQNRGLPVADRLNAPRKGPQRYRVIQSSREWLVQERNSLDLWLIVSRWAIEAEARAECARLNA